MNELAGDTVQSVARLRRNSPRERVRLARTAPRSARLVINPARRIHIGARDVGLCQNSRPVMPAAPLHVFHRNLVNPVPRVL